MFHKERPRPVHSLQIDLFHRLDRDTAPGGPTRRFADCFRIVTIIPDISGTHQLEAMPELFKRSTPIMNAHSRMPPSRSHRPAGSPPYPIPADASRIG